jgi:hypothetical protein
MPNGDLEFVGRIDHMVKVRGFRVDLEEVERALLLHPRVRHAAVLLRNRDSGDPSLLAFFAPDAADRSSIYEALRNRLPSYMVPSALVGLPSLPLTSSGKIDRRQLLEDYDRRASTDSLAPDRSDTETRVLEVWKQVVGNADIRLDRSFFEVGGTSLTAFAAIQRLRDAFRMDRTQLSDQTIYRYPTVEALASYIDGVTSGGGPLVSATNAILVTLKKGTDVSLPPLFVIASSGGALGAYEKLAKTLKTRRDVIGVRDPFLWGERDPTMGFPKWVALYLEAIRERQPRGPYYLGAYSSAGPFGYEIAQQLRRDGEHVAVLALIDPLGMDQESKWRFGYWAFRARFMRRPLFWVVRLAGWLRLAVPARMRNAGCSAEESNPALTREQFLRCAARAKTDKFHVVSLSAMLELNTGLPVALTDEELSRVQPDQYLRALIARVKAVAPDVEPLTIENIAVQYYCLQTRSMRAYGVRRYEGKMVLLEPNGPLNGLLSAQLKPHARNLDVRYLKLGTLSERTRRLSESFPAGLRLHYLSMRDDEFVRNLAAALEPLLQ